MTTRLTLFIAACLTCIGPVSAQDQSSVKMTVPFKSEVVIIAGKPTIHYELLITNHSGNAIKLSRIDIIQTSDSSNVYSIEEAEINSKYELTGKGKTDAEIVPASGTGIVYLDYVLSKVNTSLLHRIVYEDQEKGESLTIFGARFEAEGEAPITIGPPLSHGTWAAIYEPSWTRGHRRVIYTVDGKARIPGRFAIDFIKLDDHGKYASGDENLIANWLGYGVDVIAVADGTVVAVKDDFSESKTISDHLKYPADQATGNYISIDIGDRIYAFYEHLKPGSIRVKQGQKVKKGDIIAALGFTGQTTGPHLHFHLANQNSPLGAEGVPFVLEKFHTVGTYQNLDKFGKEVWSPVVNSEVRVNEFPAPNTVIKFK